MSVKVIDRWNRTLAILIVGPLTHCGIDTTLYFVTKFQLSKEQKRFASKFGSLNVEKTRAARLQNINREILSNTSNI